MGRYWSDLELEQLSQMLGAGCSVDEIARRLDRTVSSVSNCCRRLGYRHGAEQLVEVPKVCRTGSLDCMDWPYPLKKK